MSSARRRSAWAGSVAGPIVAAVLVAAPALAAVSTDDQTQLVRVTQDAATPQAGWMAQSYDASANDQHWTIPDQDYVFGPTNNPAIGAGSHVLRVGQYAGQVEEYRTAMFDGTKAGDIAHLSYATYAAATNNDASVKQPAYVRLSFNTSGDKNAAPDAYLYYEPSINHPDDVQDGVWQNWDTTNEQWSTTGGPESLTTLQDFAAANPDAVIAGTTDDADGGVAMIADGTSGQFNGVYGLDRFAITTADQSKLFDFDPSVNSVVDNVTVTDGDLHGWNAAAYNDTSDITPDQGMAFGPGNPPAAGIGSHRLTMGDDPAEVEIWRSPELDGINVGDIRTLNYSTYEKPGANSTGVQQPAYMRLSIDPGDGSDQINLYYEPAINHGSDIANNAWQTWHTNAAGEQWSTDGGPDNLTTLAAVSAKHPNATVYTPANAAGNGGLSIVVGASGDNQRNSDFYVDNVETDFFHGAEPDTDRTYDFEPTVPAPSITMPSVVTGRTSIPITGNTNTNTAAPVTLFEHDYGQTGYHQVASTTADDNGNYVFHRTVTKRTSFYVRSYDRTNSVHKTVSVRIKVNLTLSSPSKGKLKMAITTSPHAVGVRVGFYKRNSDGTHTLLAVRTTGSRGGAHATISWPSGHRITVYAVVSPPKGNLKGRSDYEHIRVT